MFCSCNYRPHKKPHNFNWANIDSLNNYSSNTLEKTSDFTDSLGAAATRFWPEVELAKNLFILLLLWHPYHYLLRIFEVFVLFLWR